MGEIKQELQQVEDELSVIEVELQELLERQSILAARRDELEAVLEQQEVATRQDKSWDGTDFPWTKELDSKLKSVFQLSSLRPMQRQTMNVTLSGEDCLLIMPTGGGKSLCFQLPAVVNTGLTLVISPLVSLMEDQQMALEQLRIPSAVLDASASKELVKTVMEDMTNPSGSLRLLYVTPEKLAKSKRFMNKLEKCYAVGHLARLVIDEVHCCSQWGHDFRPDYKFLGIMKRQFPTTPILGLTATATTKVLEDVKKILSIPKALLFKASFNRPNLFYEVRVKPATQKECVDEIHNLISKRFRKQSGIIYCFSRKDTEEMASDLQSKGVRAGCYHGDMDSKARSMVHRQWLSGDLQVVVATIAFGMGIDKPDVRFVIHHSISKSMENLYQESGRAGRDDKRSECIVYYRLADVVRQSTMVFTEQTGLVNLHGIVRYCIDVGRCRRSMIAGHFGERWDKSQCNGMCDQCHNAETSGPAEKRDVTKHCTDVLILLDAAAAIDQRVTTNKIIEAWYGRGPSSLKVKTVAVPGIGRDKAERILAHMLINGYIKEDFHFTAYSTICYLVPGSKAKLLRSKSVKVIMEFQAKSGASPQKNSVTASGATASTSSCVHQSSSSSSSSSTIKALEKESKRKPDVVIVNKQKSHFGSCSNVSETSTSLTNPGKRPASTNGTTKRKSMSSKEDKGKKVKRASPKMKESVVEVHQDDSDEFNFDDSDEGIVKERHFVKKTSQNSNYSKECEGDELTDVGMKRKGRMMNVSYVISSDDDDDFVG